MDGIQGKGDKLHENTVEDGEGDENVEAYNCRIQKDNHDCNIHGILLNLGKAKVHNLQGVWVTLVLHKVEHLPNLGKGVDIVEDGSSGE